MTAARIAIAAIVATFTATAAQAGIEPIEIDLTPYLVEVSHDGYEMSLSTQEIEQFLEGTDDRTIGPRDLHELRVKTA